MVILILILYPSLVSEECRLGFPPVMISLSCSTLCCVASSACQYQLTVLTWLGQGWLFSGNSLLGSLSPLPLDWACNYTAVSHYNEEMNKSQSVTITQVMLFKSEDWGLSSGVWRMRSEKGGRRSEGQRSEVWGQRSEVRGSRRGLSITTIRGLWVISTVHPY